MDKRYTFNTELFKEVILRFEGRFTTQKSRAEILDISQSSMSRLERGERKPTVEELRRICNRSGFSPADFFKVTTT